MTSGWGPVFIPCSFYATYVTPHPTRRDRRDNIFGRNTLSELVSVVKFGIGGHDKYRKKKEKLFFVKGKLKMGKTQARQKL